ncbi:hypothetical protein [Halorubrum sp. CSM-61]|uniref:hypothetical protein n=1 Tax=Halorubrum sp. CSM-61 TaxID=2485838 RepID=UPI000F4C5C0E|nr:hypothetical protein [Halorubrum sp. CSM-61]
MSRLPTYSLLETHEDVVSYRVPDPTGETPAWVRIGLFPWELEGAHAGEEIADELVDNDLETTVKRADGVGLRAGFHGPTSRHPSPRGYTDRVKKMLDVFSHGSEKFRIQNADAAELRQTGRWIALFGFAFWHWLKCHTDYPIGMRGTRKEMRIPKPETVLEDGTLIGPDGASYETPYTLGDIELLSPDEWETPYEQAVEQIQSTVDTLHGEIPKMVITAALRDIEDGVLDPVEETELKKEHDRIESALRNADGIGVSIRSSITSQFDTVSDLCDDLRDGGERLRSIRGIGDSTEEAVIDALVESGAWTTRKDSTDTNRSSGGEGCAE